MGKTLVSAQIQIRLGIIELWRPLKPTVGQSQQREHPEQRETEAETWASVSLSSGDSNGSFELKTFWHKGIHKAGNYS